ncbi:hypothetical protein CAC42_5124 [Sphaceloma murrayae]|uniref:Actin cytoskeleton-regulatory complex protein SLA1 n=1 Tax=Sphaceloma murrayae TaxID=2082308 RepID=A0A2K1QU49_9PEZI|nr:hypothetical protein CAC42_5124 [Sphaceloma murrayae]
MGFLGVYRAIYDYAPQGDGELEITEGDLLFVLEKSSDDDWWKAKKKAMSDEEDEPEGLIPSNYIEEAQPIYRAKALYDYTQQTDEEISFAEDAQLDVYDTTDEDWTLVGQNGEYGFAPAIYIEKTAGASNAAPAAPTMPARSQVQEPTPEPEDESPPDSPAQNPAKALAGIIAQRTGGAAPSAPGPGPASPPLPSRPPQPAQYTPEESEEDQPMPSLPQRPRSTIQAPAQEEYSAPAPPRIQAAPGVMTSPPYNRQVSDHYEDEMPPTAGGYRLYNLHEMVSSLGKNKKMPTTLGINLARGLISIAPAKARDGPQQEWTADRLTHYSIEGKHVFMELVRPSKSIDFHAGAKDTAQEIVGMLGELAGASRAEGLREVIAASSGSASSGQKKGHMLYEFMAQGDDEVTVAVGDEIIVLDDSKSEEWWMVRRLKNGKEGVVPSSYVEITGTMPQPQESSFSGVNAGRSVVEQNRMEEERMTKEAAKRHRKQQSEEFEDPGVGAQLPARQSSLATKSDGKKTAQRRRKDEAPKARPNAARVRTWTDRSGAFRVDAEFLGLKDNKIHLHKDNGVKIAVPVGKMAVEDLEYVEKMTGVSLEDDKPLSDIKRRNTQRDKERNAKKDTNGISASKEPEYDWFDFFLACNVNPQVCERYAQNFSKDQMGEEILPDVTPALLRTLGLKEGDIIRVMKHLDTKFGRANGTPTEGDAGSGGLFSGPGGALRNNTRKGRPAPAVQTSDTVDVDALKAKTGSEGDKKPAEGTETPLASAPGPSKSSGFDDDAWSVKPVKSPVGRPSQAPPAPSPAPTPTAATPVAPQAPKLTGSMGELSLLSPALEPTPAAPPAQQVATSVATQPQEAARPAADPAFFDKLGAPATQNILSQPTGRARPSAPPINTANSLIAPPPRASSAPGFPNQQQSAFAPPQPMSAQRTGFQQPMNTGFQAPPGQSLQSLQQQQTMNGNMMSPYQNGLLPQQTGFMPSPQMTGFYQQPMQMQATGSPFADPIQRPSTGFQPTPTGLSQSFTPQSQFASPNAMLPPALTPMRTGFQPQPQQNGFQQQQQQQQQPQQGFQPLQPQQTGFSPFSGASPSFASQQMTGMPPQQLPPQQLPPQQLPPQQFMNGQAMQPMQTGFAQGGVPGGGLQPLQAQKTGPAPPVRFGMAGGLKPLAPTPTGRRANLSNATPQNPFGF